MKLKIAVCDDESESAAKMSEEVDRWGKESGTDCAVQTFPSAEAFLFAYEQDNSWDILLLDVEMPGMSGVELAKKLRKMRNYAEIIFITSHFEFYGEGYEVDALHYLIKPVSRAKLYEVLTKALRRRMTEPPSVVINCEGETVKLLERDIWYVESLLHYICIHTSGGEYKMKANLSDFAKELSEDFYHTRRSYFVSLKHIKMISRTAVTMENGEKIPLSRGKYDEINRIYIERN